MATQTELVELRDLITMHFDEEEVKELCFQLGIVYSDLPSQGRKNKVRDLVTQLDRKNHLPDLLTICKRMRPHVDWPELSPSLASIPEDEQKTGQSSPNPFGRSGKIQNLNNYLVRQPLTDEVLAELEKGVSISIVGDSQSGKSSLLWHVCQNGAANLNRPAADFVYLDMQLLSNDGDFFDFLCEELGVPLSRGYRLGRHLRGRQIVLCLDEIEKMTWQGFSLELRTELRGLADGPQAPFTLMIASRSPLSQLFPDSPEMTSPLAGLCMQLNIAPFTLAETETLVTQYLNNTGLTLPSETLTNAWQQSQGHPERLQRALQASFAHTFGK